MNELYLNARIYFDTDKKTLMEAQDEFWNSLTGLNPKIEIEVDESELRDNECNVIDH